MEDEKLRELSEDFLKKNVIGFTHNNYGIIIHEFKNGRVRKIDLFKRFVQITDNNGKELYSTTFDSSHRLMKCANLYYKFHYLVKKHSKDYTEIRSLEREKNFILSQIEEIYQLM